jgi:5-methylcytosine-specific restriction protein A
MRTFLLTWNPKRWDWTYLDRSIREVTTHGYSDDQWSCGNRRDMDLDDRVLLVRLGKEPRGLVGIGWVRSVPDYGPHWDTDRAKKGDEALYIEVRFDGLSKVPLVPMEELLERPYGVVHWESQSGGTFIPPKIASALLQLWESRSGALLVSFPEEVGPSAEYVEGATRRVLVNTYERDPEAREACLAHHGYACTCCGVILSDVYGNIADEFIHVHHVVPLGEIGKSYKVNPIKDLVPVCPNCHTIIHRHKKALSINDVKNLIAKRDAS